LAGGRTGTLDGVEVQAYCHLIDQFWSDVTNTREDDYGGTLENRLRFSDRLLRAMRERVGPDFIIGIRQTADEGGMRSAPHLDMAGKIKRESALAVFHAARIPDIATARHAVASGQVDLVGMTRAHIAEPDIVKKLSEGREESIRPCVGATFCLDRIYLGQAALCVHNAATGRELDQPHRLDTADITRHVVVVGAGPAGLEAASDAGGQLRLAALNPRRRELLGIVEWRVQQCDAAGVQFRYNCWAEADTVRALEPDVVLVATGGMAHTDVLESGGELVVSAWDVIAGDAKPEGRVLLYDDAGDHTALQAAESLAKSGAALEMVTPDRGVSLDVMGVNLSPYLRELQAFDVKTTIARRLLSVERDGNALRAHFSSDYREDLSFTENYDHVVINHGTEPLSELYFDLVPHATNAGEVDYDAFIKGEPQSLTRNPDGQFQLFRLGDAVSGRNIHAAVFDGLRFGKVV